MEDKRLSRFLNQGDYLSYLRHSYFHQSLYGDMIEEYLKYFPLKNFLFIHFEDEFIRDRNQTILRILDFLEIRNDIELDLDFKSNPSSIERSKILKRFMKRKGWWRHLLKLFIPSVQLRQIIRNKIQRINLKEFKYAPIEDKFREEMYNNYFRKDIIKLEKLINRQINW